jgi:hypothetical protein
MSVAGVSETLVTMCHIPENSNLHNYLRESGTPLTVFVSSVGIATRYGLDGRSLIPDRSKRLFTPASYPMNTWGSLLGG